MSLETATTSQPQVLYMETNSAAILPKSPLAALRQPANQSKTSIHSSLIRTDNHSCEAPKADVQKSQNWSKTDQNLLCQSGDDPTKNGFNLSSNQTSGKQIFLHTPETVETLAARRTTTTPQTNSLIQPAAFRQQSTPDSFQWTSNVTPESKESIQASRKLFEVPEASFQNKSCESQEKRTNEEHKLFAENKFGKDLRDSSLQKSEDLKNYLEEKNNNQLSSEGSQGSENVDKADQTNTPYIKPFSIKESKILVDSAASSSKGLQQENLECQKELQEIAHPLKANLGGKSTDQDKYDQFKKKEDQINSLKNVEADEARSDEKVSEFKNDDMKDKQIESTPDTLRQTCCDKDTAKNFTLQDKSSAVKISEVSNLNRKFEEQSLDQSLNLAVKTKDFELNYSNANQVSSDLYPKKSASESVSAVKDTSRVLETFQSNSRNDLLTPVTQIRTLEKANFDSQDSFVSKEARLINQGAKNGQILPNQSVQDQQSRILIQILGKKREDHQGFLALLNLINPLAWSKSQPTNSLSKQASRKMESPNPYKQILRTLEMQDRALNQGDELENALNAGSLDSDHKMGQKFVGSDLKKQKQLLTIEQDNDLITKATQFLKSDALFKVMSKYSVAKNTQVTETYHPQEASKTTFQNQNSLFKELRDLSISSMNPQNKDGDQDKTGINEAGNTIEKSKCEEQEVPNNKSNDQKQNIEEAKGTTTSLKEASEKDSQLIKAMNLPLNLDKNGGINQVACSEDLADNKSSSFSVYTKKEQVADSASVADQGTSKSIQEPSEQTLAQKTTPRFENDFVDLENENKEIQALIGNPPVFDKQVNYLSEHRRQQAVLKSTQRSYKIEEIAVKSLLNEVSSLEAYNRHLKSQIVQKREEKLAFKENIRIRQAIFQHQDAEKDSERNFCGYQPNLNLDFNQGPSLTKGISLQDLRSSFAKENFPKIDRDSSFNEPSEQGKFGGKIGFKRLASLQSFEPLKSQMTQNVPSLHAQFPSRSQTNLLSQLKQQTPQQYENGPNNEQKMTTLAQLVSQFKNNSMFTPPSSSNYGVQSPPQLPLHPRNSQPFGARFASLAGNQSFGQTTGDNRILNNQTRPVSASFQHHYNQSSTNLINARNPHNGSSVLSYQTGSISGNCESLNTISANQNGKASKGAVQYMQKMKQSKRRRVANQIHKEYKCMHCDVKWYGTEAACIMHMRKKHKEGTKGEIEKREGMSIAELLLRPRPAPS